LEEVPSPDIKRIVTEKLEQVENGKRDLYF
jgi:hypothetical protein